MGEEVDEVEARNAARLPRLPIEHGEAIAVHVHVPRREIALLDDDRQRPEPLEHRASPRQPLGGHDRSELRREPREHGAGEPVPHGRRIARGARQRRRPRFDALGDAGVAARREHRERGHAAKGGLADYGQAEHVGA